MPGIASSTNVINTTFADFKGPLVEAWAQNIVAYDLLMRHSKVKSNGGTYIERDISGGAPASGRGIRSGNERLPLGYAERVQKYRVEAMRFVVTLIIPNKFLKHNMGKNAVIELIKAHPEETMMRSAQDINQFLLCGQVNTTTPVFATSELVGLATLNGIYANAGALTGTTAGYLDFALETAQTDTVQNLAKSTVYSHFNTYGAITTWATNGPKILKSTYRKAKSFDPNKAGGGPKLVIADPDVFSNWEVFSDAKVRVEVVGAKLGQSSEGRLPFENTEICTDYALDRSLFTGAAANGVTYMLNPNFMEFVWYEEFAISDFQDAGAEIDGIYAKGAGMGNLIITKFPAQACVSGGAV